LVNGRERQDLLANAADISFEVLNNRQRLRDAGKETAINVLDSEVEYYSVQANRYNAIYDTRIGSYRLLAAMGQLTPKLVGMEEAKIALPVKPFEVKFDVK
jgi:adhesin transport system outer membrane protein